MVYRPRETTVSLETSFKILSEAAKGLGPKQIAHTLDCAVGTVYAAKAKLPLFFWAEEEKDDES